MTTTTVQQISQTFTADSVIVNAAGNPGVIASSNVKQYAQWSADGYNGIANWDGRFNLDSPGMYPPAAQPRGVPASLGLPVSSRSFSFKEMAIRAWGSEWAAPDHRVYEFQNGRGFDSTDRGFTGIYRQPAP